jgi:hypothetical protein
MNMKDLRDRKDLPRSIQTGDSGEEKLLELEFENK